MSGCTAYAETVLEIGSLQVNSSWPPRDQKRALGRRSDPDYGLPAGTRAYDRFDGLRRRLIRASMKVPPGVDCDRLAGHRVGAAHRDHHVGAVVLVGRLFQERGGRGILDLLAPQVGGRASAL